MTTLRLLAFALFLAGPLVGAPLTYQLDPVHSSVTFSAKTLFTPIHGSFLLGEGGVLVFDRANPSASRIEATVPIASISTRNEMRDKNITTKEGWFAANSFPAARFVSERWETTDVSNRFRVTGKFTLNGRTESIVIVTTVLGTGPGLEPGVEVIGLEGHVTLDRTRFGITADPAIIASTIPVVLTLQGIRRTGTP
jgi:polyisoprenoid-binding protein YceI